MPRDGSGIYSKPAGTTASPNTTIESAKYNSVVDDLVSDANAARPITAGGTGATSKQGVVSALFDGTTIVDDDNLKIAANGDQTKLLALDLSGITTATTRTLTVPDRSGTLAVSSTSFVTRQIFTSSGTYTPTPGMVFADIICVASGAGGGGTTASSTGMQASAGGGGAGEVALKRVTAADVGASKAVTVGAGGAGAAAGNNSGTNGSDSSVGSLCVAKAGNGGAGNNLNSGSAGGSGGIGGTGDLLLTGQPGGDGAGGIGIDYDTCSGEGGTPGFGYGAGGRQLRSTSSAGRNGTGYGAGGSGGMDRGGASARGGGSGSQGIVIILEYVF